MHQSDVPAASSASTLLDEIFETVPVGIIILDNEGRILRVNRWQEKISRIRREEVVGTYFHETWRGLFDQGILDRYWQLLHYKEPYDLVVDKVRPQFYEGSLSAIMRGAPLASGQGFVLLNEVSEEMKHDKRTLEKLADQLAKSRNFLNNLIDCSPNIVITTDPRGLIRSCNRTAASTFEYDEASFVGRDISFLFDGDVDLSASAAGATGRLGVEVLCRKRNGTVFPAWIRVRDITDRNGEFQAKLVIIIDLTEIKSMEERLRLSEKLANFSELMAGIAHQINNPLIGVVNFSSLLLDKVSRDDRNREMVQTIHEAAQECKRLISSMLKSIQEPTSTFRDIDVGDVLESSIEHCMKNHDPSTSRVSTRVQIDNDLPTVTGDPLQLHQAFQNIVTNAVQAMPGGGDLHVSAQRSGAEDAIRIRFRDTGGGIPEQDLPRIFDPFFSTKRAPGRGLGLSFAYQVVRSHAGRIDVSSTVNQGTVFTVILPVSETGGAR